ncbi:hypothetical protein NQ315_013517, partial [Exocentrus adspersus]
PVICLDCSDKVKTIFEFKSACLYTEDFVTPFVNAEEGNQTDLKQIYLKQKGNRVLIDALRGRKLCRLCMSVVDDGFVYLDGRLCALQIPNVAQNTPSKQIYVRLI